MNFMPSCRPLEQLSEQIPCFQWPTAEEIESCELLAVERNVVLTMGS